MLLGVERQGFKLTLRVPSPFCGFAPSQNKVSRDPSSYVKLSVGKKTYLSKVSQLGMEPRTEKMGGQHFSGREAKEKGISLQRMPGRCQQTVAILHYFIFKITSQNSFISRI